ncbi:MAG: hypothetical protein R3B55_01650 [Candidatus Paceibacterota bacterium]
MKPLQSSVFNLAYDNFLGRMGVCRMYEGVIRDGQRFSPKTHKEIFTQENFLNFSLSKV